MSWDYKEQIAKDFPLDKFEHIRISDPSEAEGVIVNLAFQSRKPVVGQTRWVSSDEGYIIVPKEAVDETPQSVSCSVPSCWICRLSDWIASWFKKGDRS